MDPVNFRVLRQVLGVTGNQLYMWHQRRKTTGFPEAVASTLVPQHPGDKKRAPLFDPEEVFEWYAAYDPNQNRGRHWRAKREQTSV